MENQELTPEQEKVAEVIRPFVRKIVRAVMEAWKVIKKFLKQVWVAFVRHTRVCAKAGDKNAIVIAAFLRKSARRRARRKRSIEAVRV
ncbi:hypothetical protein [Terribacillus saccharophilus]|uniref:hypothetical protein n=1 Tax=Terribacillus saccharophilus TaxID=361277 RepID=UPI000BA54CFA|nr:hypothetical protein [Terribacillus saccharophilus]PAF19733.1 hypothetical protein CHH51_01335 [Terribacillus saccharophilus]